jgi:hypothetical protein
MSCVKHAEGVFFLFLLKAVFLFACLSARADFQNVDLAPQPRQRLLILLSVHDLARPAPVDSCGHRQETSAPNLQIGPLPAPVRLRARAVSKVSVQTSWVKGGNFGFTGGR